MNRNCTWYGVSRNGTFFIREYARERLAGQAEPRSGSNVKNGVRNQP